MSALSVVLKLEAFDQGALDTADAFPLPGGEIDEEAFAFSLPGSRSTDYIAATDGRTTASDDTPADTAIPGSFTGGFNFEISLFAGLDPTGGTAASAGNLTLLDPADPITGLGEHEGLLQKSLDGATLTLLRGPSGDPVSSYDTAAVLATAGIENPPGLKRLKVRELGWLLNTPLHDSRFLGTGGLEGPAELANVVRPIGFGRVRNVAPRLVDADLLLFQLSCTPIEAIDAIKEGGVGLGWYADYGSVAALKAALLATAVPAGYYGTALDDGYFGLGGLLADHKTITADFRGDAASLGGVGYIETRAAIARRIAIGRGVQRFTTDQLDEAAFTALDAAQPGVCGWYFDQAVTKAQALQEVMPGCLGRAYVGLDGLLTVGHHTAPASTPDLVLTVPQRGQDGGDGDIVTLEYDGYYAPRQATALGWARNYTIQQQSDLRDAVSQADVALLKEASRKVRQETSALARNWPTSAIVTTESGFYYEADAQAECDRIQALLGDPTLRRWKARTSLDVYTRVLGLTAQVKGYAPFGGVKNFRVVGAAGDSTNKLTLSLVG